MLARQPPPRLPPLLLLLVVLLVVAVPVWGAELSAAECEQRGFVRAELACATCDEVAAFVSDAPELVAECRRCCTAGGLSSAVHALYEAARVEICHWKVTSYGHVKDVIEKVLPKEQQRVSVRYVMGSDPYVVFFNRTGAGASSPERVPVGRLTYDDIVELLQGKLLPVPGAKRGGGDDDDDDDDDDDGKR